MRDAIKLAEGRQGVFESNGIVGPVQNEQRGRNESPDSKRAALHRRHIEFTSNFAANGITSPKAMVVEGTQPSQGGHDGMRRG